MIEHNETAALLPWCRGPQPNAPVPPPVAQPKTPLFTKTQPLSGYFTGGTKAGPSKGRFFFVFFASDSESFDIEVESLYIYISFCTRDTGVNCLPLAVNRSIDPRPPRCKVAKPHRGDCKAFTEWPLGLSHLSHRDNLTSCQPKCQQPRCKPARSLRHIALNQLIPCAR